MNLQTCKMERKIKVVAKKLTFAEAEEADDEFWSKANHGERLKELQELRRIFFGNADGKIKKVVLKRNRYEDEN